MRFDRGRVAVRRWLLVGLIGLSVASLMGCQAEVVEQDEVTESARQRVVTNVLPPIVTESEAALRNLLNLLAALPQICATPLAELGDFVSALPALGAPVATFDPDGSWLMTWQNVVLGDDSGTAIATGVDLSLEVRFLGSAGGVLRAVPFSLAPEAALDTVGTAESFANSSLTEGFFLSQDADTGVWTLRWRTQNTQVFAGTVTASSGIRRLIRRVVDGAGNEVTSLDINDVATEVTFGERTTASDAKGFTFFVRPGDPVRFRLRIGPDVETAASIGRDALRIGDGDQALPAAQDPADFTLFRNVPLEVKGAPVWTPGTDLGTFIWLDTDTNDCDPASEDQWRIRFSSEGPARIFTGTVTAEEDEGGPAQVQGTAVGGCPAGSLGRGGRQFEYDCTLQGAAEGGYDLCVSRGRRLIFGPRVDDVRDPSRVSIGANNASPPSPDPFSVLVDVTLTERAGGLDLRFSDARVTIRGNNDEAGSAPLNADQVSLDPLCRRVDERIQPRVRLTGSGDYSTTRFEGSAYELDNVEFTDAKVGNLGTSNRFPDRGEVRLRTRVEGEIDNTDITVPVEDIRPVDGKVKGQIDIELRLSGVRFTFLDQTVDLTVE